MLANGGNYKETIKEIILYNLTRLFNLFTLALK